MDMILVSGVVVGLVLGSFGYVLVRFGARPVLAYRCLKQHLAGLLDTASKEQAIPTEVRDTLRRIALELQDMLDEMLPGWYRLALQKNGEQPEDAVRHLQALVNCKEPAAIRQRIEAVQDCLRLVGCARAETPGN
jgi:hypothetical protein